MAKNKTNPQALDFPRGRYCVESKTGDLWQDDDRGLFVFDHERIWRPVDMGSLTFTSFKKKRLNVTMLNDAIQDGLSKAKTKHPKPLLLLTALSEECGEVVKEVLNNYNDSDSGSLSKVRDELIHVIVVSIRLLMEGDPMHGLPATVMIDESFRSLEDEG